MITAWAADTLIIAVPVTFEAGAAVASLSGATLTAKARKSSGTVVIGAAIALGSAEARITFASGSLASGEWRLQLRVEIDGITQTVLDENITILPSV